MTKLELLSNATTIDSALDFIRTKQAQHKKSDSTNDDDSQLSKTQECGNCRQSVFQRDMFLHDDKWHDPEVAEWMYRMMNDPEYYEQWRFKDTMHGPVVYSINSRA